MGMRVTGISSVSSTLQQQGARTNKRAIAEMKAGGELIQELAKKQAPVDKANLEKAIKLTSNIINPLRATVSVFVDEGTSAGGKLVGTYATRMHEGVYELGPRSRLKQRANPNITVGRKYLENAVDELEDEIVKAMKAAVEGSL